jgi:hypothetical protein
MVSIERGGLDSSNLYIVKAGIFFFTSPVWLYMCVVKELGRVNLLVQTVHLYRLGTVELALVLKLDIRPAPGRHCLES